MQRSRSRSGLIETAFVGGGASCSSAEDLDDLDRLANHPVLRSKNAASSNNSNATSYRQRWERARAAPGLRKSRSESGEVLLGGWGALDYPSPSASFSGAAAASAAAADAVVITADASVSNQASPTADSVSSGVAASAQLPPRPRSGRDSVPGFSSSGRVLGRRAMAAMASRFGRLTRSATAAGPADFYQSSRSVPGPPGSPANSSTTSATSSWVFHHHHSRVQQQQQQQQQQQHHQHFHHHFAHRQFHYLRHQKQQQLSRSAPSTPPTWSEVKIDAIGGEGGGGSPAAGSTVSEQQQQQNPKDQRLQHQRHQMQVVRAVIENATTPTTHRDFASSLTPPPNTAQKNEPSQAAADPAAVSTATPPNTAPLPAKFGRLSVMPHNLLKSKHGGGGVGQERISSAAVVDSSEDGSINDITQADVDDKELEEEEEEEEPKAKPKSRFSLSLRSRLQMDSKVVGDRDGGDSSSAESTPDRRAKQQEQQHQQMHQKKRPSLPIKGMVIRRGAEAKPSKLHFGQQKVPPPLLPKPIQDLSKPSAAATGGAKSKFFSSGESSCSSAMSSMESVRSNASDGVHSMVSSESGGQASSGASGVGGSVVPGGRFAVGIGIGIGVGGASSMSCSEAGSEASSSSLATPPPPQSTTLLQQQRRPTLELRQGKHAVGLSKFQVMTHDLQDMHWKNSVYMHFRSLPIFVNPKIVFPSLCGGD